jgi:cytidyltransferase-like protein
MCEKTGCNWCLSPHCLGQCDLATGIKEYYRQVGRFNNDFARLVHLAEMGIIRQQLDGALVCTSGGYDPPHFGHLGMLSHSKRFGKYLLVIVSGDEFLRRKKGAPFMPLAERAAILTAVRGVDFVLPYEQSIAGDDSVSIVLEMIRPDCFAKGGDRVNGNFDEFELCQTLGIEVVYPPAFQTKTRSSSDFLKAWSLRSASSEARG